MTNPYSDSEEYWNNMWSNFRKKLDFDFNGGWFNVFWFIFLFDVFVYSVYFTFKLLTYFIK